MHDIKWLRENDPKQYEQYLNQVDRCAELANEKKQGARQYQQQCVGTHRQQQTVSDVIREEFKRLPLPKGELMFQPSWGALVNKREIFYSSSPRDHDYPITLLGRHVVLRTHVDTYAWSWGDASSTEATRAPGGPYPNFAVSHTYRKAGTCQVTLGLTYSATYTVDGGPQQTVLGTISIAGNPTNVRVVGAHSVLVGGGH
ncbi:MAG TPA: hypothetical protein VHX59_16765 [Mycobacteriales bacterium]|nr:hypothetical protein [Mycobacteriales bacterium]